METGLPVVRATTAQDLDAVCGLLEAAWGSVLVARRNEVLDCSTYPAFLAFLGGEAAGLAVVIRGEDGYEILSLSAKIGSRGVGQALMRQCFADAVEQGYERVWLMTTNDNVRALDFYQRVGMHICAIHLGAVEQARALKPQIPLRNAVGVPIEHEIELEWLVGDPVGGPG